MNRRERRKEQTRTALLTAAMALFVRQGIYTTRVEDITEAADVAKGVFYNYFESKFDVVAELLQDGVRELEGAYLNQVSRRLPAGQRIRTLVEKHEAFWRERPDYALLFHQGRGLLLLTPQISPQLNQVFRHYLEIIAAKLAPGAKSKTVSERSLQMAAALAGLIAGNRSFALAAGIEPDLKLTLRIALEGLSAGRLPAPKPA